MNSPIDLKCLSVNIRGLNKSLKRRAVFRWLHNQHCPFVFLLETYNSKECENIWQAEWGGEVFLPGPSPRLAPVIKCSPFLSFLNVTLWGIHRWLTFGSARWLIEILSAILKSARQLLGERPLRCTSLWAKIWEWIFGETNLRAFTSEPSIVKLIENKSDLLSFKAFPPSSKLSLPSCRFQVVASKLSLPTCHFQLVASR